MKIRISRVSPGCLSLTLLALCAGCSSVSMPSMSSLWPSGARVEPSEEALFQEANRNFDEKRYVRALDNYQKIRSDYPFSPLMTQVELKIADSYYRNQQYPEAINAFKEFQAMHPTNESIPFVFLRLGQSHFNQFTSVDRDQKNTEIAKGYFETVVSKYPKSAEAAEAREKLAKCLEYLAEHEFMIGSFYLQQEKFPAARDRFEEIVRKYKDTPTAVKSLYYLGESYRREKNSVRAVLAYEALLQHYPTSKYAAEARTQLAQVEKEKNDPLALLLMRDRRPSGAPAPEVQPDPALAKLRDLNLVAKTEVVNEDPGGDKGFIARVADKLNPFSSSDKPKEQPAPATAEELLAQRSAAQKKNQSSGVLSSLWPFGGSNQKTAAVGTQDSAATGIVSQIDQSLKQKGIDSAAQQQALKPPAPDLPKTDDLALAAKAPPPADTTVLLSSVDSKLQRSGVKNELPPAPEAAPALSDPAVRQNAIAAQTPEASKDVQSSGILSSIDQKLQARGVNPTNIEAAPTPEQVKAAAAQKPQARNVEIEPKVTLEKGPLFLSPSETPAERPAASTTPAKQGAVEEGAPSSRQLVKGPIQAPSANPAPRQTDARSAPREDDPKGVFDQIRQDIESASKVLSPFSW